MQITNGTVSRTVKPADYEARTVSLSFAVDPGDNVETALATVLSLCERYARTSDAPAEVHHVTPAEVRHLAPAEAVVGAIAGATTPRQATRAARKPPVVQTTAELPEAGTTTAEPGPIVPAETAGEAAPEQSASPPAEASASPAETGEPAAKEITNADLNAAINATHQRLGTEYEELRGDDPEKVKLRGDLIRVWRDTVTGVVGMSVGQMDQPQRVRFLAGLKTLAPEV